MDIRRKQEPMEAYIEQYEMLTSGLDRVIGKGNLRLIIKTAKAARNAAVEIVSILEKYRYPGKFVWLERIEELNMIINSAISQGVREWL